MKRWKLDYSFKDGVISDAVLNESVRGGWVKYSDIAEFLNIVRRLAKLNKRSNNNCDAIYHGMVNDLIIKATVMFDYHNLHNGEGN